MVYPGNPTGYYLAWGPQPKVLHRESLQMLPGNLSTIISLKVKQLETGSFLQNNRLLKTSLAPQEHYRRYFTFGAISEKRDFAVGKRRQNNNFALAD